MLKLWIRKKVNELYIIKNISDVCINIDGVNILPYQTVNFDTIKSTITLNKYTNRHMVNIDVVNNEVKSTEVVNETKEENTIINDIDKTYKSKKKSTKVDDNENPTKGEVTNASD